MLLDAHPINHEPNHRNVTQTIENNPPIIDMTCDDDETDYDDEPKQLVDPPRRAAPNLVDRAQTWKVGDRCLAKFRAQPGMQNWRSSAAATWYAATIHSVSDDNKRFDLVYDDGDKEALVPLRFLRREEPAEAAAAAAAPASDEKKTEGKRARTPDSDASSDSKTSDDEKKKAKRQRRELGSLMEHATNHCRPAGLARGVFGAPTGPRCAKKAPADEQKSEPENPSRVPCSVNHQAELPKPEDVSCERGDVLIDPLIDQAAAQARELPRPKDPTDFEPVTEVATAERLAPPPAEDEDKTLNKTGTENAPAAAGGTRLKMIDLLVKDGLGLSATLCAALVDAVGCENKAKYRSVRLNLRQNPAVVTALTNAQERGDDFALLLRCVCDLSIFTREKEQIQLPIRPEGADEYRYVAGQFLPRE